MDVTATPLVGLALVAGSVGLFWLFLPRKGRPRRWDKLPFLQSMVALATVSGMAIGGAMCFSIFVH